MEDFRTFDENDDNGRFEVLELTIAVTALTAEADHNVVKDYGPGHFANLPNGINWDAIVTAAANQSSMVTLAMTNTPAKSYSEHRPENDNAPSVWCTFSKSSGAEMQFTLQTFGTTNVFDIGSWSDSTRIYFTFTRSGTIFIVEMYSDSDRTTLIDTLSIDSIGTAFQHLFAVNNLYSLFPTGPAMTGDVSNYELLDEPVSPGRDVITGPIRPPIPNNLFLRRRAA